MNKAEIEEKVNALRSKLEDEVRLEVAKTTFEPKQIEAVWQAKET